MAARHGVRLIVAFGSRATGRAHAHSDLDIAVLPEPGCEVSLADLADPLLLKKIFETGVLLHGDAAEFRRYRVYAFRRFSEYLPYLRLEEQATRRLVRRLSHAD